MSKESLEQLAEEEYKYVKQYTATPVYSMQVNKQGCKVIIEAFARDYRFIEDAGESMSIPFNYMILKSGKQRVKIKVYPKKGDKYITKYAHVQVKLYHAPDKNSSLKDYKPLGELTLPQGLEPQHLPYYEQELIFDATVPFDYSQELAGAKDLKQMPNIEELVKNKYLNIQKIAKEENGEKFIKEFLFSFGKTSNTTYEALDALKAVYKDGIPFTIVSPLALNKEFFPLDDCELQFYADGKIAALWHKERMTSGLDMKYEYENEDGSKKNSTSYLPMFLYMPAGSKELKVW